MKRSRDCPAGTYLPRTVDDRQVAQAHRSKQVENLTNRGLGVGNVGTGVHVGGHILKFSVVSYIDGIRKGKLTQSSLFSYT